MKLQPASLSVEHGREGGDTQALMPPSDGIGGKQALMVSAPRSDAVARRMPLVAIKCGIIDVGGMGLGSKSVEPTCSYLLGTLPPLFLPFFIMPRWQGQSF